MRRTRLVGPQATLWPDWRHFAFLTDLEGSAVDLDAFHRHHAVVELAIDDLKEGAGMEHCPSGSFSANGAWLCCAVLAHNLMRWTVSLFRTESRGDRWALRLMVVMLPCSSCGCRGSDGGAAAHVVAVVAPAVVIGDEPGVGFGLELADRGEVTAMEGRSPALLEDGAVEALAHGVVVGRAGRDPLVTESLGRQVAPEVAGHVFGTVVAEDGPDPDPVAPIVRAAPGR